jgi:peptidoglycan/xylan/chitin deacetylase (PgdA/CDA1 family)
MYLSSDYIGGTGNRRMFKGKECLIWDEVRELHQAGIEFGSHTISHPILVDLSPAELENELSGSKYSIEHQLGCRISSFAYPYAFPRGRRAFAAQLRECLSQAGYQNCVTTAIGRVKEGDDPYCLKRLPISQADDLRLLAAKLQGAYDWLAVVQSLVKAFKRR